MYSMPQSNEMSSSVVSSRTSRSAASMGSSPASTRPLGKSQFRYARSNKNLSFRATTLTTTTPADSLVSGAAEGITRSPSELPRLLYSPPCTLAARRELIVEKLIKSSKQIDYLYRQHRVGANESQGHEVS